MSRIRSQTAPRSGSLSGAQCTCSSMHRRTSWKTWSGLELANPDQGWRQRPDMNIQRTRRFRAGVAARARFIEDLVLEHAARGVHQYVILGAGLDTFAQRRPEMASRLQIFEIDRPGRRAFRDSYRRERPIAARC